MGAVTPFLPLIAQAVQMLIPIVAPFLLALVENGIGRLGAQIPASLKPAVNAGMGAALSAVTGTDPTFGAVVAHVVRSGMAHEPVNPVPRKAP